MQNLPFQYQFAVVQNFQNALRKSYFSGINNGSKTINGISLISDAFTLSQYPDIVDELCNSRAFIRKICTHKIDKAYQKEPILRLPEEYISDKEVEYIQNKFYKLIKLPRNPFNYFGRMSPAQAIKEALYLSEKHGGALLMASYEDENILSTPIDIQEDVDTKRKLYFTPISISGNNVGVAKQFFQEIATGDIQQANKTLTDLNAGKPYQISYPNGNDVISIQLHIGTPHIKIHTSRLLPILSGYKNYSIRSNWYQGWDNSVLQGAMKSVINYYLFLDTLPEMLREKIMNKVILEEDLMRLTEETRQNLIDGIKGFGESMGVSTYNILPRGTQIQRDELSLNGINEIYQALQQQIIMDTDSIKADIIGEGGAGLGNGGDDQATTLSYEKLSRIHEKYDFVYQFVYSRILKNMFSNLLKDVQVNDIEILFDTTPLETAKEKRDFQMQLIDKSLQMVQAGVITSDAMKNIINNLDITGLQINETVDL